VVDNLVETAILGYKFLDQHLACLDLRRGCLHLGAEERSTIFLGAASTERPQSLQEALAVEDVQHGFPKQLEPELRQLLREFRDVFNNDHYSHDKAHNSPERPHAIPGAALPLLGQEETPH
jgi:hypothetical protein